MTAVAFTSRPEASQALALQHLRDLVDAVAVQGQLDAGFLVDGPEVVDVGGDLRLRDRLRGSASNSAAGISRSRAAMGVGVPPPERRACR